MKTLTQYLNWLTITASGLCATLLLVTGAQATESITTTSSSATATFAQSSPSQRIALRKKKRLKKKAARKAKTTATVTPATTSAKDLLAQATPPPAPTEVAPPSATPPVASPTPAPNAPKVETPAPSQFSLNTKLEGQVIFGGAGVFSGDFERNAAFGHRTRLELSTDINGGTLTTRLQAVGLGLSNQRDTAANPGAFTTNEGNLSYTDGTTDSSIGIDALKYEFAIAPQG